MAVVCLTQVEKQFVSSLAWDNFWSTQVEIYFVSSMACERFVEMHFVFAGMGKVCSTHVELHFVSSLAWEGFVEHMLRCIF
jgi:hypothetical protein